jgi:hypothetical protein
MSQHTAINSSGPTSLHEQFCSSRCRQSHPHLYSSSHRPKQVFQHSTVSRKSISHYLISIYGVPGDLVSGCYYIFYMPA